MTVGGIIENLIYIKGTRELREWEVETINEACNVLSQQKGKPMTNLDLLNTLKKTTDCIRQKYPNQVLEIRATKETFGKLAICNQAMNCGMLSLDGKIDVIIVPDTYFPDGVSHDAVLVCSKCSEPTVIFESGEML